MKKISRDNNPGRRLIVSMVALAAAVCGGGRAVGQEAKPNAPAELVVTERTLRPAEKVPPLGANGWGGCGAVEWAANKFVHNAGNEPVYWRNLHRAKNCGPNWFEIDGPGTTWYDLWASGFLSGASVRVYRIVDREGKPLEPKGDYLDLDKADHVVLAGKTTVLPEGSPGFPDGGWVANTYATPFPNAWVRHGNLACTDASGLESGRAYWYVVTAVGADDQESEPSSEAIATPQSGADTPPHIIIHGNDDKLPELRSGAGFEFTPKVFGGQAPNRWEVLDNDGRPTSLSASLNLKLDPATGRISGKPQADAADLRFELRVTDAKGRSDRRWYAINPKSPAGASPKSKSKVNVKTKAAAAVPKPEPPQGLTAVAGDGCVTLSWKASPSPNVVAYRLKRSVAPAAKQEQRVYVAPGGPALEQVGLRRAGKALRQLRHEIRQPAGPRHRQPHGRPGVVLARRSEAGLVLAGAAPQARARGNGGPGRDVHGGAGVGRAAGDQPVRVHRHGAGRRVDLVRPVGAGQAVPAGGLAAAGRARRRRRGDFLLRPRLPGHPADVPGQRAMAQIHLRFHRPAAPARSLALRPHLHVYRSGQAVDGQLPDLPRLPAGGRRSTLYVPNATVFQELMASQPAAGPKARAPHLVPHPRRHDVVDPELARQLVRQPGLEHVGAGNDGDDRADGPDVRPLHGPRSGVAHAAVAGAPARSAQRAGLAELRRVPGRPL